MNIRYYIVKILHSYITTAKITFIQTNSKQFKIFHHKMKQFSSNVNKINT